VNGSCADFQDEHNEPEQSRADGLNFSGPMGCASKNAMFTPHFPGNGTRTTYKNFDDWGMVYEIVLPTSIMVIIWYIYMVFNHIIVAINLTTLLLFCIF
jgi:hypothetical protein